MTRLMPQIAMALLMLTMACAGTGPQSGRMVSEEGLNTVRVEADPDGSVNRHPASLTAQEIASLLRGVRSWERRNTIHRLLIGESKRTRAFRDDEIAFLAPALAKALAQAKRLVVVAGDRAVPTGQRTVEPGLLELVADAQLSHSEAAVALGISPNAARLRLARARRRLRKLLPADPPAGLTTPNTEVSSHDH